MPSRRIKGTGPHYYLYERESYWDPEQKHSRQHETYIGPCDKNGNLLEPEPRIPQPHAAFPVGALSVFYATARDLRITDHIQRVLDTNEEQASHMLILALNQLIGHRSLEKLPHWIQQTPLPQWEPINAESIERSTFDKALHALCHTTPDGVLQDQGLVLQHALTKAWRGTTREPAQYYYDITKQVYYGTNSPYAEPGYFPGGTRKHVIGFGMVTSRHHHYPVLCRAIPGSRNDTVTVQDTVHALQGFGFEKLTLIMDRGMVSKPNIEFVVESGYDQVGIVPETNTSAWEYVAQWSSESLEQPRFLVDRSDGNMVYARAWTASLLGQKKMRVAVVVNPFRKASEQVARDHLLLDLERTKSQARVREIRGELGELAKPARGRRGFKVDEKAVREDQKGDGRFLMFSTDTSMDAEEMVRVYSQRESIEKSFRTVKGELSLGPIRYRKKEKIDAYTTVVYLAYLLWSMAERKLKQKYPEMSLGTALDVLESVAWVRFGSGNRVHDWVTRPSKEQEELLKHLGCTQFLPVG